MATSNREVARLLGEIGALLEIQGENPFKIRAYTRAAEQIDHLAEPISSLSTEDLEAIPGVGEAIAGKIQDILNAGTCAELERLRAATPRASSASSISTGSARRRSGNSGPASGWMGSKPLRLQHEADGSGP